jgi:hypothetical protein
MPRDRHDPLPSHGTLLEAVKHSLELAARYNPSDVVAPAAILWTDADAEWQPLVELLRPLMPELMTHGEYQPAHKTGPAIWLRCVIDGTLPEVAILENATPVIYMPHVSRQTLRAVEECPDALQPLVELQYRGVVWTQKNGKDWTVEAFLVSEDGGLGLDVATDRLTRQAMQGALSPLAATPMARLVGKRLEAEDFNKLMLGDPIRDLLVWLNDPEGMRQQWHEAKWKAFCSHCKAEYHFDPDGDGDIVAGEKLGCHTDAWDVVWLRYKESPTLYPNIPSLLRRAKPSELLFDKEPWPDENDGQEEVLRAALMGLASANPAEARTTIQALEQEHGPRREWVWCTLGLSPLAVTLQHLAVLAEQTATSLGGDAVDTMAKRYIESAWRADDAALKALAAVKSIEDHTAVERAIRSLYLPWLDDTARHLQALVSQESLPDATAREPVIAEAGECLLFVDGLRFDVSQRLMTMLQKRQIHVTHHFRWSTLPTVTATAKPAVSPIADKLQGHTPGQTYQPELREDGQALTTERFRKAVVAAGYQLLDASQTGHPDQPDARGWTEFGEFDKLGHRIQAKLAARIDEQLELLVERIEQLFEAGWTRVRIVTDHGWLLVPGGLPVVALPKYLTESRWQRCASIKDSSQVTVPVASWHWNAMARFAYAPGVHCFMQGTEYTHGGVSLQECLIPDMTLTSGTTSSPTAVQVASIQWSGLRCRVTLESGASDISVDLRTKPNDPGSTITTPRKVEADGRVGLLVADETLEGMTVSVVLLDAAGRVIDKAATTVGGAD